MMSGLPRVAARERAAEVLRHVGLAEERYRPMGGYSTGMKQKAKLAQALAHDPRLVLLDEPTNGLDPAARDEMLGLVRRIGHDFGIAVIVTSHLLGELERVSDNVIVLDGGRLLRASRTDEFLDATGVLLVEVMGDDAQSRMAAALTNAGVASAARGTMLTVDASVDTSDGAVDVRDLIRDAASDLGLGLVRLQVDHRRIEDVFADADADATDADTAAQPGGAS
jgi:ABC-2 type transport system ATP-binding protein